MPFSAVDLYKNPSIPIHTRLEAYRKPREYGSVAWGVIGMVYLGLSKLNAYSIGGNMSERNDIAANNMAHEIEVVTRAINNPDIEKVYFNGFTNTVGSGDIVLLLYSNGVPIKVLNTSYTIAKTLSEKLNAMIEAFEKTTGNSIMTADFVQQKMAGQ